MKRWIFGLLILSSALANARPYRFYLDPRKAEQILAGINFGPRLADEEWLKLINFERQSKRQIQSGDNLWNIARGQFGDPFLWRKLWQENPWLTNPHDLEIGRILNYYREGDESDAPKRIPIVKLRPDKSGTMSDVDNDIYVNRVFKARYRLNYIVIKDEDFIGEVTGSYSDRTQLSSNDDFYVSFMEDKKVEPGSTFTIVREEKDLKDKTQLGEPVIGKMARILAEIRIKSVEMNLAKAELISQAYPVNRGDKLILNPKVAGETSAEYPPKDSIAQVVMLDDERRAFGRQGELLVINKGLAHGMKEGFLFKVFEDTDPVKKNQTAVTPDSKGEIRLVYVGNEISVGVVNRNTSPIRIGDSLLSFTELPDRPVPPRRVRQEINID